MILQSLSNIGSSVQNIRYRDNIRFDDIADQKVIYHHSANTHSVFRFGVKTPKTFGKLVKRENGFRNPIVLPHCVLRRSKLNSDIRIQLLHVSDYLICNPDRIAFIFCDYPETLKMYLRHPAPFRSGNPHNLSVVFREFLLRSSHVHLCRQA